MAGRPGGNPNIAKHGFKKGDPRINRKGAPKKIPILKALLDELLGVPDGKDLTDSEMAKVIQAMIGTAKAKSNKNQIAAAKELLERAFGKVATKIELPNGGLPVSFPITKTYIQHGKGKDK